jgi:hypothetical protein
MVSFKENLSELGNAENKPVLPAAKAGKAAIQSKANHLPGHPYSQRQANATACKMRMHGRVGMHAEHSSGKKNGVCALGDDDRSMYGPFQPPPPIALARRAATLVISCMRCFGCR